MNVNSLVLIHLLKYSLDSILSRKGGETYTRISEHKNLCWRNPQHISDSNLYIMRVKSLHKQKAFLSHSGTFLFAMLLKRYNSFFAKVSFMLRLTINLHRFVKLAFSILQKFRFLNFLEAFLELQKEFKLLKVS